MRKKRKLHRLLSMLLCCVLVLSMLPTTTAYASREDGEECPGCGHFHWDEYLCECGYCSINCTNATCWIETHCLNCAACHGENVFCPDCSMCVDCREEDHCPDCGKCFVGDTDGFCPDCGKCEDCAGWLCLDCSQCDECSGNGEFHCEECGGCYEVNGHEHGTHCADCCIVCEECGECITEKDDVEICPECGLCEECCVRNREDSDCSCGEYCVESVEFEEHFCEQCGTCFDDVEQCELCNLCMDCSEDNSDCADGMCVEDSEYEEHFCEDCGTCFCEAEPCETCCDEGELRCVYCCESLASSYGCNCGDMCVNDPEFEEHLDTIHSEDGVIGPHSAKPQIVWSMNDTDHWHGCRLCNEDSHISDKENHTYDKYGVCTVCGFKQGAAVFITHQPRDTYTKVTDINADENNPLYWKNNRVSFKVSAYGEGLTYQWYRRAGTGTPKALTTSNPEFYSYGEGADTDKVTVYVPGDACTTVYTYYCVVTDRDGNTATSNAARIKAGHVYSYCQNVTTGSASLIYIQSGSGYDRVSYYKSEGHFWSCCGEEDHGDGETDFGNTRTREPVNHNYGNQELIQATNSSKNALARKFDTYYRYTCSDCGHQIYVKKHIHNFECPISDTEYLEANCTALTHPLACTVSGCTETRKEQHRWQWKIVEYPSESKAGGMMRECLDCDYWENKGWTNESGDPVQWTTANMLVSASHGTVNRSLAAPGEKLNLTPEQTDGKKCTGWIADYTDYSGATPVTKTVSVTVTQNSDGTWSCIVPTFAAMGVNGGGQLGFMAQFAACSHTDGTKVEGTREAVCTRNGYTGDKVCKACGKILEVGDPIPGGKEHTGTLTLVAGTAVEADCTHRGYTGDLKCSACGGIVKGERTGYDHSKQGFYDLVGYIEPTCTTEGYSGDEVCSDPECRKVVSHGKILPITHKDIHTKNFKSPTCTASGYSGDKYCAICGETVELGKTTPPRGHNWNTGYVTSQPTETERGERLLTCMTCSATMVEYISRLSASDNVITRVSASVQRPIMGETPAEAVSSKPEQYTVIRTVWVGGTPAVFAPDKKYTVRITLKANNGYRFPAVGQVFAGLVNGNSAAIGDRSTDQVTIEYTFPKTAPADHVHVFDQEDFPAGALVSEADCTHNAVYFYSCECGKIGNASNAGTFEEEDSALGHDWSEEWSKDADNHWHVCKRCGEIDTETSASHTFGSAWKSDSTNHWKVCSCGAKSNVSAHRYQWVTDKAATTSVAGSKHEECKVCGRKSGKTASIPMILSATAQQASKKLGLTPQGAKTITEFASKNKIPTDVLYVTEKSITTQKSEDVKAATYNTLSARATSTSKSKITLKWNKVKGANGYIIYGNKCGTKNKYKKLKTLNSKQTTYSQSKLKKGTYYKYLVVAYKLVDGKKVTISASKTIHATTTGGKYGNAKAVKVSKTKVTVKKNKSYTLKASEVKKDKKISIHRKIAFESSNPAIATVNSKGKITGKKKGTCYIYAYAHNGVYSKVKVTVK